jgi:hypothetical protein
MQETPVAAADWNRFGRCGMMVREPDKAVGNGGNGRVRAIMQ